MANIHGTVMRSTPQQDLVNEMRFFIRGVTNIEKSNLIDLTKCALLLLKSLPATRNAIFEYFSKVFTNAAFNYIEAIEVRFQINIQNLQFILFCRLK